MDVLYSVAIVIFVWLVLGFRIIKEDESAVVVLLGSPRRIVRSGLCHTWWPLEKVVRFTTNLIELEFRRAGIITAKNGEYGAANIGVDTTMYFRWPEDERLIASLKTVGSPENKEALTNLFEETALDAFRSEGGCVTWKEITQDRKKFADNVLRALTDELSDPVNQAGLPKETLRLVIRHLELTKNLEESITKPEIARMEKEAVIEKANGEKAKLTLEGEGTKQKFILEGEGKADARKKLYDAIGKEPADIQKEVLLTLREMAQGTSNTILFPIPSEITDVLSEIFGKKSVAGKINFEKFLAELSDGQRQRLKKLLENPGGIR